MTTKTPIDAFNDLAAAFILREASHRAVLDYIYRQKNGDAAKAWTIALVRHTRDLVRATYDDIGV